MLINMKYPNVVHSHEAFDGDKPFDLIELLGVISKPDNRSPANNGILSAVLRYFTTYSADIRDRLLFSIGLGDSIYVNTILVNTVITEWILALEFDPIIVRSKKLKWT